MKQIVLVSALSAALWLAACAAPASNATPTPNAGGKIDEEAEVRNLVLGFGKRLQDVSLQAPDAAQEMEDRYSRFVSRALLETWKRDPLQAPGRIVSSPWPDRIEITSVTREAPDRYMVDGFLVEITSVEIASGGAADKIPVHIVVQRDQGRWLITQYAEEH